MSGWDNKSVEDLVKTVDVAYSQQIHDKILVQELGLIPDDANSEYQTYVGGKLQDSKPTPAPVQQNVKDHVLAAQLGIKPHSKVFNIVKAKMDAAMEKYDEQMAAKEDDWYKSKATAVIGNPASSNSDWVKNKFTGNNTFSVPQKVAEANAKYEAEMTKAFNECGKGLPSPDKMVLLGYDSVKKKWSEDQALKELEKAGAIEKVSLNIETPPPYPPVWFDESVQIDEEVLNKLKKGVWQGMIPVQNGDPNTDKTPQPGTIGAIDPSLTSWWSSKANVHASNYGMIPPGSLVEVPLDYKPNPKYVSKPISPSDFTFKGKDWQSDPPMIVPTKTVTWSTIKDQYANGGMSKLGAPNGGTWYGPASAAGPITPPPNPGTSVQPMWTLETAQSYIADLQLRVKKHGYHLCLGGGVLNKGKSKKDLDLYFLPLDNGDYSVDSHALLLKIQSYFGGIKIEPLGKPYETNYNVPYVFKGKFTYHPYGSPSPLRIDIFVMGNESHHEGVRFFLSQNAEGEALTLGNENIIHYNKKKQEPTGLDFDCNDIPF